MRIIPPRFLFGHLVYLRAFAGKNAIGEKVYANSAVLDAWSVDSFSPNTGTYTIKARFEPTVNNSRQPDKSTKQYRATLFVLGTDIPTESVVIFEDNKYIVSECIKHTDLEGISYLEVLLS